MSHRLRTNAELCTSNKPIRQFCAKLVYIAVDGRQRKKKNHKTKKTTKSMEKLVKTNIEHVVCVLEDKIKSERPLCYYLCSRVIVLFGRCCANNTHRSGPNNTKTGGCKYDLKKKIFSHQQIGFFYNEYIISLLGIL